MNENPKNRQKRLHLIVAAIMLVGLGSAALIYLTAADVSGSPLGFEPEDSKRYLHDLELYGGKMNVLVSEFMNWFGGLWQGRRLAFTTACITLGISAGVLLLADDAVADPPAGPH